jgi:invasion protein IalB
MMRQLNFKSLPLISLSLLIIFFGLFSLNAHAKPEHGKKFKDWTVACEKLPTTGDEICNIFQRVSNDKKNVVMQIAIGYMPGKNKPQAIVTLPLGVILPPGIEFTGGTAKPFSVPFSVCLKSGCVAIAPLDTDVIKGMKAGDKGSIKFAAGTNKQVIQVPVSLSGFTAAFNSLK